MTTELWLLVASIILGLAQLIAASHLISFQYGYRWTASSREEPVPPLRGLANRVDQATTNFLETFPFFRRSRLGGACDSPSQLTHPVGCTPVFLGTLRVCLGCGGRLWSTAFCSFLERGACGYGTFPGCAIRMNITA